VLLRRYKRFLADVRLSNGDVVVAHCVNTGAMEGLIVAGAPVWLRHAPSPTRKLAYTWELAKVQGVTIGVNTSVPNGVVGELLARDALPWIRPRRRGARAWTERRPERPYGDGRRIDFYLSNGTEEVWLEVKNCHLVYDDGAAYFPDCVSKRAAHHVDALAELIRPGVRAHVLFFVQVPTAQRVRPSDVHDPAFARAARRAHDKGVEFSAVRVVQTPKTTVVDARLPVDLDVYDLEPVREARARLAAAVG
jgi:sugar fermentation stimulation protein A